MRKISASFLFMITQKTFLFISILLISSLQSEAKSADPCKPEKTSLCKTANTPFLMMECLKQNSSGLSGECKEELESLQSSMKEKMDLCSDDRSRLCKWVIPGQGRIIKCLKEQETKLSDGCKKVLADFYERMK